MVTRDYQPPRAVVIRNIRPIRYHRIVIVLGAEPAERRPTRAPRLSTRSNNPQDAA